MGKNKSIISREYILDLLSTSMISLLFIYFLSSTGLHLIIAPIPFAVLGIKYSYRELILSYLIVSIGLIFFMDAYALIFNLLFIIAISISISYMFKNKKSIGSTILLTFGITFAILIAGFGAIYLATDINPIIILKDTLNTAVDGLESVLQNDINFSPAEITNYLVSFKEAIGYIVSILPALLVIYSLVIASLNTILTVKLLNKAGIGDIKDIKLNNINIAKELRPIISFIAFVVIILYFISFENGDLIVNNLSSIMFFLLFINGLLYAEYFLEKRFNIFVRYILIFFFVFILQGYFILTIIGLFDGLMDFRQRDRQIKG